jgi:DNA polymerase III sliding clamp (beta) subunit (PCNA family)
MQVSINPDYFRVTHSFVSKEETRYYLGGVYVEPCESGGVFLVATDGHRLGLFHDKTGETDGTYIIRMSKIDAAFRSKLAVKAVFTDSIVKVQNEHGDTIHAGGFDLVDGTFPDWRRVIPSSTEKTREVADGDTLCTFNAAYLADFGFQPQSTKRNAPIEIFGTDPSSPHFIINKAFPDFVGVLMPVKAGKRFPSVARDILSAANPVKLAA